MPRAPLHSMNGVALKSSKQLPGLESDCPPPSAPAAVCFKLISIQSNSVLNAKFYWLHTIAKLYPIQSDVQLCGHSGILSDWLWTAITFAGASHTTQRLIYCRMASSPTGIIGMGALVESQYDLSLRLA